MSRLNPHLTGVTIEQYLSHQASSEMEDELIEGEIVMSPSPMPEHTDICARLYDLLKPLVENSPFLVRQDTSMRLHTSESMPRPDVFVIDRVRWNTAAANKLYPVGSPQLVIEVFSPSDDTGAFRKKPQMYLSAGASAVWIVHPEPQTIERFDRNGRQEFACGQDIPLPPPLPRGRVRVDELFLSQ